MAEYKVEQNTEFFFEMKKQKQGDKEIKDLLGKEL